MKEAELAEYLGVPRTQLVKFRKENPEYTYKVGPAIHWTEGGSAALYVELGLDRPPDYKPKETFATTERCYFPNKKGVEARLDDGKQILVRVKDSGMFVPKMRIPIKPNGNGWTVAKHPKRRGRM